MCGNCDTCRRNIYSSGVSIVDGTLVIDIPATSFYNCQKGCLLIVQDFPAETTLAAPVAISIGGDTTTLYPVIGCNGQITATMITPNKRYPFIVVLNTTPGSIKIVNGLLPGRRPVISNIPAVEAATTSTTGTTE